VSKTRPAPIMKPKVPVYKSKVEELIEEFKYVDE